MELLAVHIIALALNVSVRTVARRAIRERWPFEARKGKGGGRLYPLATLPQDVQLALARIKASEEASLGREIALKAKMDAIAPSPAQERKTLSFNGLSDKSKRRADARIVLVEACRSFIRTANLPQKRGKMLFANEYSAGNIEVDAWVREELPSVSWASLKNWEQSIEREGVASLAGKFGQHRRGTGKIESNPAAHDLALAIIAEFPDASAVFLHDALKIRLKIEVPCLRTTQAWYARWRSLNPRLLLDLQSPDACRSAYQPAAGSKFESILRLNQRWELDSTKADIMLQDGEKRTRHIIVGCIDVYSRRVKLHVSRSSNSAAVAALLRRCILDWGVPEEIGTDNGSDYVSEHIVRIACNLGIHRDVAPPFTPEHKPFIERVFKTFLHGLVEGLAGYIGHNVADRKHIEGRKSFAQRICKSLYSREPAPVEILMTPEQLQKFCDEWADYLYMNKPHSGEGMNGKTPSQRVADWTRPIRAIEATRERDLDLLMAPAAGKKGWREIRKKGIKLDGRWFSAPELGGFEGRSVHCLQDDTDWGAIYVYLPNESTGTHEFLCRAVDPLTTGISRKDAAQARRRIYNKTKAEERQAMQAKAKALGVKDIVREIMTSAVEQAGKLSRLPKPSLAHTTPALEEAAKAARIQDAPKPSLCLAQRQDAKAKASQAAVERLPETRKQRFARWQALDERVKAGEHLIQIEHDFWNLYRTSAECRAELAMLRHSEGSQAVM